MNDFVGPGPKKRWHSPIAWPPSSWTWSPARQQTLEVVAVVLLVLGACTIVAVIVVWVASIYFAITLAFEPSGADRIRNLLLALAGIFGAPFVVWRTVILHQQTQISRENHYTTLFTKAVELLSADKVTKKVDFRPRFKTDKDGNWLHDKNGDPVPATRPDKSPLGDYSSFETTDLNLEVRLGAIYALERIAQDSVRDRWPIYETLAAYIRNNSSPAATEKDVQNRLLSKAATRGTSFLEPAKAWTLEIPKMRPDVLAAVGVLGRRYPNQQSVSGTDANARILSLAESNLQNLDVERLVFANCDFSRVRLDGATLSNVNMSECKCYKLSAEFSTLRDCNLSGGFLLEAQFVYSEFDGIQALGATLMKANFNRSTLDDCNLRGADVSLSNFSSARIRNTNADNADFSEVDFRQARLSQTSFRGASLVNANFAMAELNGVDFEGADLRGANLLCAGLQSSKNLTNEQIAVAFSAANLPPEFSFEKLGASVSYELDELWRKWRSGQLPSSEYANAP